MEAQARAGQYDQAIATFKSMADRKDGALPLDGILMQLGRTYLDAGKATDAQQTFNRLVEDGPMVANFIGLENLALFSDRVRARGWPLDIAQVQIWQGHPLAGLTTMAPLRPVWIVRTSRPRGPAR